MLRDPLRQHWRGPPRLHHADGIRLSDLLYKGQAPRAARAVRRGAPRPAARRAQQTFANQHTNKQPCKHARVCG